MDKKFPYINVDEIQNYFSTTFAKASADTIAWIGLVLILASTIPTMLSIMSGLSDKVPPVDLILFIWAGLSMMFIRATIVKDMLHIVTIGAGFIIHASLLALILFK